MHCTTATVNVRIHKGVLHSPDVCISEVPVISLFALSALRQAIVREPTRLCPLVRRTADEPSAVRPTPSALRPTPSARADSRPDPGRSGGGGLPLPLRSGRSVISVVPLRESQFPISALLTLALEGWGFCVPSCRQNPRSADLPADTIASGIAPDPPASRQSTALGAL